MFDSNNLDELEHEEDHFKLFGMQDKQFTLDMQQLEKKFKELQRLYHPDKNVNKSEVNCCVSLIFFSLSKSRLKNYQPKLHVPMIH